MFRRTFYKHMGVIDHHPSFFLLTTRVLFSFTVIAFTFLFIWCVLPTDSSLLVGHDYQNKLKMSKHVSFKDQCEVLLPSEENDSSSSEDFYEITTSEAESISSSEEEDTQLVEFALESAYSCSPSLFLKGSKPSERTSLLFLDKDLIDEFEYSEGVCVWVCVCVCVILFQKFSTSFRFATVGICMSACARFKLISHGSLFKCLFQL